MQHHYRYNIKPVQEANQGDKVPNYRHKFKQFKNMCKKFTTFLFSRVGLCVVVIGKHISYIFLGVILNYE